MAVRQARATHEIMERISVNVTLDFGYHKLRSVIWPGQLLSITARSRHKERVLEILLTQNILPRWRSTGCPSRDEHSFQSVKIYSKDKNLCLAF